MKVLFLTLFSEIGGSSRTRVFQFLPFLKQAGIKTDVRIIYQDKFFKIQGGFIKTNKAIKEIHFLSYLIWSLFKRMYFILSAQRYDIVFIQKDVFPRSLYWLLRKINPHIVYDFDDAIYETNPFLNRNLLNYWILRYQSRMFQNMVQGATWVIAYTEGLAQEAKKYNKNVSVISAPIDTDFFCPSPRIGHNSYSMITLGWIGSPSSSPSLKSIEPMFAELAKRHPNVQLKIVGTGPDFSLSGIKVIKKDWLLIDERADIQSFDIGLMPLDNTPRNKSHFGYKIIQYMSVGIPVVASDMGLNKAVIQNGVNGFLVDDLHGWIEKLSLLITDSSLRHVLGENGRKLVEEKFSLKRQANVMIEILKRIYNNNNHGFI